LNECTPASSYFITFDYFYLTVHCWSCFYVNRVIMIMIMIMIINGKCCNNILTFHFTLLLAKNIFKKIDKLLRRISVASAMLS